MAGYLTVSPNAVYLQSVPKIRKSITTHSLSDIQLDVHALDRIILTAM